MNHPKKMPPLEALEKFYRLDPESPSGLTRIKRTQGPNGHLGHVLSMGTDGYWRMKFSGECYRTNRIIYYMSHREDPGLLVVDHIDGNPLNNCAENLRACTQQQNTLNARGKRGGLGLPKGITALPGGMYKVSLPVGGVRHSCTLGNLHAAKCYLRSVRAQAHGEYARA